MDMEKFCDNYCPIPLILYEIGNPDNHYAECDLEDNECPFKDVDFSKVTERNEQGEVS